MHIHELPMLEADSNVGKFTRHDRQKKAADEPPQDDDASQVPPTNHVSSISSSVLISPQGCCDMFFNSCQALALQVRAPARFLHLHIPWKGIRIRIGMIFERLVHAAPCRTATAMPRQRPVTEQRMQRQTQRPPATQLAERGPKRVCVFHSQFLIHGRGMSTAVRASDTPNCHFANIKLLPAEQSYAMVAGNYT
jgi:hypothetical protein